MLLEARTVLTTQKFVAHESRFGQTKFYYAHLLGSVRLEYDSTVRKAEI